MKKTIIIMTIIIVILAICLIQVEADNRDLIAQNTNLEQSLEDAQNKCETLEDQLTYWYNQAYQIALAGETEEDDSHDYVEPIVSDEYKSELEYNSRKNTWGN